MIGSLKTFNPATSIGFIAVSGLPRNGCTFRLSDCEIDPAILRPGMAVEFVLADDPGAIPGLKFVARKVRLHKPPVTRSDLVAMATVDQAHQQEAEWRERIGQPFVASPSQAIRDRASHPVRPPLARRAS